MARPDTFTRTEYDAGRYEYMTAPSGYSRYSEDAPSRAEAERDAAMDRAEEERRQKREDAARARGEYVPTASMGLIVGCARFSIPGAVAVREGVLWLPDTTIEQARAALTGDRYEFAEGEGGTWVRVLTNLYGEPFAAEDDGPPFS